MRSSDWSSDVCSSDLAMLAHCAENAQALSAQYGNVTKASVGAIQRQLLQLESQGGAKFFGEPALDIADFIGTDDKGRGYVNVLAADRLMSSPRDRKSTRLNSSH